MEKTFAIRLKERRNKLGYTQAALSKLCNISKASIARYEQGGKENKEPSAYALLRLAQILDITPEELLLGEGTNMNIYSQAIQNELSQIKSINVLKEIKELELNSTILPHLELSEDLVSNVQKAWHKNNLFEVEGQSHTCYKNYVRDIIIRYAQNRQDLKLKYNLQDGMLPQLN